MSRAFKAFQRVIIECSVVLPKLVRDRYRGSVVVELSLSQEREALFLSSPKTWKVEQEKRKSEKSDKERANGDFPQESVRTISYELYRVRIVVIKGTRI